ncbi:uncharacterized protein PHALS_06774 [Plasmopara halstedii]|uniref:WRKY19-like zinc finger domain-containing protein n=1 Tax=Plasmopara halstedii TaxID=4781 RepID=A0A0P1B2M5_PLAHL|nr:uncharacterized protein PHALS_06774 [Plasmopara halstedii]CEG48984.1 hypothetical protein PHALS_06774 [Plasmopara halstedii]|eukprot:XP_024585353.1 hypothetical protein PHALS_06774 [Plasmopara halstedii]
MTHAMPSTIDWRANTEDTDYAFMLFHPDTETDTSTNPYEEAQTLYTTTNVHPTLCTTINQALSDEEMLDEIFQEIMSPGPHDHEISQKGFDMALFSPVASTPSTPELSSPQRRECLSSSSLGSMSPNLAAPLRMTSMPVTSGHNRNNVFFPLLHDPKVRLNTNYNVHPTSMLFVSPTAAARRSYRRMSRLQKKKPASRICRMPGCTKGIRSRGLCKAHGGGRRCTTPGCEISDQGGGHCIAHGGGRRCSVGGCQKSAQSKGLCKLHGGARLCRLPDCSKNGQIKGLCRLHYSLSMATKTSAKASVPMVLDLDPPTTCNPCDTFDLRIQQCLASIPL